MIELIKHGVYLKDGLPSDPAPDMPSPENGRERTIAYSTLRSHDRSKDPKKMRIVFDSML